MIFDPVGGEVSLQAFRSIAWNGRHLVVGFAAGSIPALPFNLPLLKGGALLGVDLAQIPRARAGGVPARDGAIVPGWRHGNSSRWSARSFAFEDFRDAFRTMQNRVGAWEDGRQDRLASRNNQMPDVNEDHGERAA